MTTIAAIALILGAIALVLELYSRAYKKGYSAGHDSGWKAADNWWTGAERQVDQTRQEIWREEA
jgi:hypothetical protein